MKYAIFCALFVSAFSNLNAQSDRNVEKGVFKINALPIGVSYELGAGRNTTFNFDLNLAAGLRAGGDPGPEFGIWPIFGADFRYYYNMERRLGKGKNILGNSGNYVSIVNKFRFGNALVGKLDFSSDYYYTTGVVYGIQRMRPKGFYWGASVGPGIYVDQFNVNVGLIGSIRLGWVLGKRK